jgi:hypothetical protein
MHLPAAVRPALVGRDREQAELAAAPADARAGHGRAVLLLGEARMGKSVLAGRAGRGGRDAGRPRRMLLSRRRGVCALPPQVRRDSEGRNL